MKVPQFVIAGALSIAIALEAWALIEIVNLKVDVAKLSAKVEALQPHLAYEPDRSAQTAQR